MKDFLFVFRSEQRTGPMPSPEEMQASMQKWMDWLGNIAAQNHLTSAGNALLPHGPYTEIKETIGGYSIVKAESLDEAVSLANGCPIFAVGGNVEVREIVGM